MSHPTPLPRTIRSSRKEPMIKTLVVQLTINKAITTRLSLTRTNRHTLANLVTPKMTTAMIRINIRVMNNLKLSSLVTTKTNRYWWTLSLRTNVNQFLTKDLLSLTNRQPVVTQRLLKEALPSQSGIKTFCLIITRIPRSSMRRPQLTICRPRLKKSRICCTWKLKNRLRTSRPSLDWCSTIRDRAKATESALKESLLLAREARVETGTTDWFQLHAAIAHGSEHTMNCLTKKMCR